jgi:hypothetical protein
MSSTMILNIRHLSLVTSLSLGLLGLAVIPGCGAPQPEDEPAPAVEEAAFGSTEQGVTYGTPVLIKPCHDVYRTWSSPHGGVAIKSNSTCTAAGCSCGGTGTYGLRYQCMELANRYFIHNVFGTQNARIRASVAKSMCSAAKEMTTYYKVRYPGSSYRPVAGDALIWTNSGAGHVAMVTNSSGSTVNFVHQNARYSSTKAWVTGSVPWYSTHTFGKLNSTTTAKCWIHPRK